MANLVQKSDENPARQVPLEYLMSTSESGLRGFEMAQLARAANFRKEIEQMTRERDKAQVLAEFARLLIDNRDEILRCAVANLPIQKVKRLKK